MFADPVTITLPGPDQEGHSHEGDSTPSYTSTAAGGAVHSSPYQYSGSLSPRQMTENANHFAYLLAFSKVLPGRVV